MALAYSSSSLPSSSPLRKNNERQTIDTRTVKELGQTPQEDHSTRSNTMGFTRHQTHDKNRNGGIHSSLPQNCWSKDMKNIDWFGLTLLLIVYFGLSLCFGGINDIYIWQWNIWGLIIYTIMFALFILPLIALLRGWGCDTPATCYFCGSTKVSCMFQAGMGSIHHACSRHSRKAMDNADMNFAHLPLTKRSK